MYKYIERPRVIPNVTGFQFIISVQDICMLSKCLWVRVSGAPLPTELLNIEINICNGNCLKIDFF